jgi:hypothetical protein
MRATVAALLASVVCAGLSGCSTHRRNLESNAPPQGVPAQSSGELASVALSLIDRASRRANLLSSEALAPLTEAAALTFGRTGSIKAYTSTQTFANALLGARVKRGAVSGFFAARNAAAPSARLTAIAGLALARAFAATRNPPYARAAREAAIAVTSRALGWTKASAGEGVRAASGQGPNIAMTANAALLLKRAGALGVAGLEPKSRAAFRTIYLSQAAVGSWYATVGRKIPMSLAEWGSTLYDLSADGSTPSLGVLGAGMPHLYANVFGRRGQLLRERQASRSPVGIAIALRALAAWEATGLAEEAFGQMLKLRRPDGTITVAASDDTISQAYFALAFAQRLAGPAHGA